MPQTQMKLWHIEPIEWKLASNKPKLARLVD
jgi:hypothetical protein